MKTITRRHIMALDPCYDPKDIGFTDDIKLTPIEFIDQFRDKVESKGDVYWLLLRKQYITDREMRLFAVWCARNALKLVDSPDPRSIESCDVAERFANGEATSEQLAAAKAAAWAAWDAAEAQSEAADQSAAWAAAEAAKSAAWAARAAARAAAEDAAWAAKSAAWAAAEAAMADAWAAWAAAEAQSEAAARAAAWTAAEAQAEDAQINKLRSIFAGDPIL